MQLAIFAGILACICYGFAAFLLVRSLKTNASLSRPLLLGTAVLGLVMHAIALHHSLFGRNGVELGFVNELSLFGFVLAACGTLLAPFRNNQALLAPTYPVAALGTLADLLLHDQVTPHIVLTGTMVTHILLSIIAYSVIALALSQALLIAIQNYQLKHRHIHDILHILPPLQTMEDILFDFIKIGLVLLTLAISTGFLFVQDMVAQHLVHKIVFAIASWGVLALMLIGRKQWGWRGMVAVKWTLVSFVLLSLAYFGSKFVLEVLLQKV